MARLVIPRLESVVLWLLPGAAVGRAATARTRAGAGDRAVGQLLDEEVVVRLRLSVDLVAIAGCVDGHSDRARQARAAARAAGVGVLVRVAGLHLADHVASVGL